MSDQRGELPNPGTQEAIDAGCTCPVIDNGGGRRYLGMEDIFCCSEGCPIHWPIKVVHGCNIGKTQFVEESEMSEMSNMVDLRELAERAKAASAMTSEEAFDAIIKDIHRAKRRYEREIKAWDARSADINEALNGSAGEHCSVCGQDPAIQIEGTYWLCHDCVSEELQNFAEFKAWAFMHHAASYGVFLKQRNSE